MINKLYSRINGSILKTLKDTRELVKNNPNDFLANIMYKKARNIYWLGKFSSSKNNKLEEEFLCNAYKEQYGYFDIVGFKCSIFNRTIFDGLRDLWFPYYYKKWASTLSDEGTYENNEVYVKEGDVIFDVGANVGMFSIYASKKVKCKIYSFEPVKYTFNILEETIKLNGVENTIIPVNKGVFNCIGYENIKMNINENIGDSSIIFNNNVVNSEQIELTTIDDFVIDNKIERIDFIKADIEGAERLMLEGAKNTIKNFKPNLAICTYHLPDDKEVLTRLILDANPDYKIEYTSHKLFAYCK